VTVTATAAATWSVAATTAGEDPLDWTAVNSHKEIAIPTTTTGHAAPPPTPAVRDRETATGTATAAATWSVAATTAMGDLPAWTAVNSHEEIATPTTTTGPAAPDTINAMMERGTVILTLTVVAA